MSNRTYYSEEAAERARKQQAAIIVVVMVLGLALGAIIAILYAPREGLLWQEGLAGVLPLSVDGEGDARTIAVRTPKARVIANVNAEYHRDPAAIREALYQQVVSPVRWQACVERLIADGCGEFWEIGPNRHLTGMMRKINRKVPTTNVSTAADLSAQ